LLTGFECLEAAYGVGLFHVSGISIDERCPTVRAIVTSGKSQHANADNEAL
jgi:hypothetical protein